MDTPAHLSHQRENMDRLHARDGRKGGSIVDPLLLNETTRHQPHLVLDHLPCLVLQLEHSLQGDWMVASGQIKELPGSVHLLLHCSAPGRVPFCFSIGRWLLSVRQVELNVEVAVHGR